jgi:phage shock protein A
MALIDRMSRLFTADVHAVLDRIEEPDVLLKHAVREMEEALARNQQRARVLAHEDEALGERQRKTDALLAQLAAELDVCFASSNDTLARKVIKRRLETERLSTHVAERRAALDKERAALDTTVEEQREQLDVMRQKMELMTVTTAGDEPHSGDFAVGETEVEVALLRERQKRQRP